MTITSTLPTQQANARYRAAHEKLIRHLQVYNDELIGAGYLEDLDDYLTMTVSPAFGANVPWSQFEDALLAYAELQDVMDGISPEIIRNASGTDNNTLELLADKQDLLDMHIRAVLNAIGIW